MKANKITVKYIDHAILFFIILFLASLTNSIFINQVGYYGALLLILCRYFYTSENQFFKTGLELPFLLLIIAEIVSSIFGLNQSQSFYFMLKRVLIIPTFYVFTVAARNINKAKILFNMFVIFSIISWTVFLYFAFDFWIHNRYSLASSGPAIYQMIITTSELISFTVILLFAFVLNEKANWKYRIFYMAGFCITLLALLASFKRTGWVGTAAGILAILITKKQWKVIAVGCIAVIALFLIEKNESTVFEYSFDKSKIELINSFETEGRAYNAIFEMDTIIVSDFENGLLIVHNNEIVYRINMPEAVTEFRKWRDNFYVAHLADKRFILIKKPGSELQKIDEFISPGFVRSFDIANGYLYVNDLDSGLTIYRNPFELNDTLRYPMLNKNIIMTVDSAHIFFVSQSNEAMIYELENYLPSVDNYFNYQFDKFTSLNYINNLVIKSDWNGTSVYDIKHGMLNQLSTNSMLKAIHKVKASDGKLLITTLNKLLYVIDLDSSGSLNIEADYSLGYIPSSMDIENSKIITTNVIQGRLNSIFDIHSPNNFVRFALWRAGWEMFKDHPIFGVGDIDLAFLYKKYKRNFDKEIHGHLHNNYINILVILGLFGFIVVMFLFIKIFTANNKIYFGLKEIPFASSFALGTIGVFISFIVSGFFEWNFGDHEIMTMLWFILGLNFGINKLAIKQGNNRM
jgi:O-Antigen ligase